MTHKTFKKICILQISILLISFSPVRTQVKELNQLVYNKQFTELETALASTKLSPDQRLIYKAFLMSAFNQPAQSNQLIKSILDKNILKGDDTLRYHLLKSAYDNFIQLNNYSAAYHASEALIENYLWLMDSTDLTNRKEEIKIYRPLQSVEPQSAIKQGSSEIPIKLDLAGLINIPVQIADSSYFFVFDTGANMSTITQSWAKRLGLAILPDASITVEAGLTGINTVAQLGIAKELHIGNVIIQNTVFLIFPDSALTFAGGAYKINGIIGLPVIKALDEISFTKTTLTIPAEAGINQQKHNLAIHEFSLLIYLNYLGQSLPFTFDTGAQESLFSRNFYTRYKNNLDSASTASQLTIGGAGGSKNLSTVKASNIDLKLNGLPVHFPDSHVTLDASPVSSKFYFGNLGLDLVHQFKKFTINFSKAYIVTEN